MTRKSLSLVASVGLVTLLYGASPASAQAIAPSLGVESTYGIASSTFTNTAAGTTITGDVCYTTAPAVAPTISGSTLTPCPAATGTDQSTALGVLNGQACTNLGIAVTLNNAPGHTTGVYTPGCYFSTGAMSITLGTTVTLSGAGVYVFRSGGALTTGDNSLVTLAGGACESDVFWAPIGLTTLGANAAASATPTFVGSILDAAGITIGHFANLTGRALAFGGTVTTDANTITVPTCAAFVPAAPPTPPTLSKAFSPATFDAGGVSRLTITLNNPNAAAIALTAAFTDTLPSGVLVAAVPNLFTTCGGAVAAPSGGSTVTLAAGSTIPSGSCTIGVNVTAAAAGAYTNTVAVNALQTGSGSNTVAANAVLTIAAAVPTLSEWAMIMLAALLCLGGFFAIRRRRMTH